jgi:Na+-driven multidrug efflux pump
MGNAVAVMIGQSLGANDMQRARTDVWKLMSFSFFSCVVIGSVLAILSPVFPLIYNTDEGVRFLAARFILTAACIMPVNSIAHACYFTLRSGGSTIITFLFDSVYTWAVNIPFALLLVYGTGLDIMMLYPICQLVEIVKSAIGLILVKKGVWIRNIVSGHETSAEIAGQEG